MYLLCNRPDNTHWTSFQADFLDSRESANADQCVCGNILSYFQSHHVRCVPRPFFDESRLGDSFGAGCVTLHALRQFPSRKQRIAQDPQGHDSRSSSSISEARPMTAVFVSTWALWTLRATHRARACCLHMKPFFLPNDISTPSVLADSSSWIDTNCVVTDREKPKQPQLIEVDQVKC